MLSVLSVLPVLSVLSVLVLSMALELVSVSPPPLLGVTSVLPSVPVAVQPGGHGRAAS